LRLLDPDGDLEHLVSPMGASIRSSIAKDRPGSTRKRQMSTEWITDDVCDSIEEQFGLAFVPLRHV